MQMKGDQGVRPTTVADIIASVLPTAIPGRARRAAPFAREVPRAAGPSSCWEHDPLIDTYRGPFAQTALLQNRVLLPRRGR